MGHPCRRFHVEARFRQKFVRWALDTPIGHLARKAPEVFLDLSEAAPPRVCAALFRTLWNGWCTARRFQKEGSCCLGCSPFARDCIDHPAVCPFALRLKRCSGLKRSSLASFLCLDGMEQHGLVVHALATYAVFRVANHFRGKSPPISAKRHEHWCKAGAPGHSTCVNIFERRWHGDDTNRYVSG